MNTTVESISALEKRINLSLPLAAIETEVNNRLKRLARTARFDGFRPGKAPMRLVMQQYGTSVRTEVMGDAMRDRIGAAFSELKLRVAGYPRIETRPVADGDTELGFTATFEIYPDVSLGDLSALTVERPVHEVDEADIDRTIAILRRQRTTYSPVDRAAADGDQVTIDYHGTLDGVPFEGGAAEGFALVLGAGATLKDFEGPIAGMKAGESKSFELTFPEDYHGKEVAGKTVTFSISVQAVAEPVAPELSADFLTQFGIEDGKVETFRAEIRENLEREVKRKIKTLLAARVMEKLAETTSFEIPKALIEMETHDLMERTWAQYEQRGLKRKDVPLQPAFFEADAKRRAHVGLIVGAIIDQQDVEAKPEQIRARIEEMAASYEDPDELINYYYADDARLDQVKNMVTEENVVEWVLGQVQVEDKPTDFDVLMGIQQ